MSVEETEDLLLILSVALQDAQHHMLYNERTGFTSAVIQQFVTQNFNTALENYDDESIERFFKEPSEKGLRQLYATVRKPLRESLRITDNASDYEKRRLNEYFSFFHAFAVPPIQYARWGNVLLRRYALDFFHLIEQFSLDREPGTYNEVLARILMPYTNQRAIAENEESDYFQGIRTPYKMMTQWIEIMNQFAETLNNDADLLLKKRILALVAEARNNGTNELNAQWKSSLHMHRRLKPLIEPMKQLWLNTNVVALTGSLLKIFDSPINQFILRSQRVDFRCVKAFADSGLLETIHRIDQDLHLPLKLSTILFIAESPQIEERNGYRIRFIKTVVDFYKRTHCSVDKEERMVSFGDSAMYAHKLLRLWVRSGDIESLAIALIEASFPAEDLIRGISLPNMALIAFNDMDYTIEYQDNPVTKKATSIVNLIVHEENEPLPVIPVTTPVQKQKTVDAEPILLSEKQFGILQSPIDVEINDDSVDEAIEFLSSNKKGNRLKVPLYDHDHFVSSHEFGVLVDLVFEYSSKAKDKWLTDENLRFAMGLLELQRDKFFIVDSTVILNYCFGYKSSGGNEEEEEARDISLPDEVFLPGMLVLIPVIDSKEPGNTSHWTTLLLYNEKAYYIDSLDSVPSQRMAEKYYKKIRSDPRNTTLLHHEREEVIHRIRVKNQNSGWECGYYVITIAKWLAQYTELATDDLVAFITTLSARNAFSVERFKFDARNLISIILTQNVKTIYGVVQSNEMEVERDPFLIPREDVPINEIEEEVIREASVENNSDSQSTGSQSIIIAVSPRKKPSIASKAPRFQSWTVNHVDIPSRDKFRNDADYNRFSEFITQLDEDILIELVDRYHTRKIGFLLYNATLAVYGEIPSNFDIDAVDDQLRPPVIKVRLAALDIELSEEFFIENHLFGSPMDKKVIDYLDSISLPTSNVDAQNEVREIIKEYGEWSIHEMISRSTTPTFATGDWRISLWWLNGLKSNAPTDFKVMGVEPLICVKLTPTSMRRLIFLKIKPVYVEEPRHIFSVDGDDDEFGIFKSLVDEMESNGKNDDYESISASRFFKLYTKGYYIGKGTYGIAVLYRFSVDEPLSYDRRKTTVKEYEYVVKYQIKSDFTARGPSTQRIIGAVKERNTMLLIQNSFQKTPFYEPKFHHHIEVVDYVKIKTNMENHIIEKLHNRSQKIQETFKAMRLEQKISARTKELEVDAIIMEFVNNGTLYEFTAFNHSDRSAPFNLPLFIQVVIQVSSYLSRLYRLHGFVHHDLSPNNIMFDRVKTESIRYLAYNDANGEPLFVIPYAGFIVKVMDLGKATVITKESNFITNPCFDMENLLLSYLTAILRSIKPHRNYRDEPIRYLRWNSVVVNFIRRLLRTKEQARADYRIDERKEDQKRRIAYESFSFIRHALDHICDHRPIDRKASFLDSVTRKRLVQNGIFKVNIVNENDIRQIDALLACLDHVYETNDLWRAIPPLDYHLNCYERLAALVRETTPSYCYSEFVKQSEDYDDDIDVAQMNDYV